MSRLVSSSFLIPSPSFLSIVRHKKTGKPVPEMGKTTYVYRNLPDPGGDFEENEYLPRRLSYWPPNLGQHRPRNRVRPWHKIKGRLTLYPPEPDTRPEYTEEAEYPEITDYVVQNDLHRDKQARLKWYQQIRQLPTVTQKMFELTNLDRQHVIRIKAWSGHYNNLYHYQNMTRTNLIHGLPDLYNQMDVSPVKSAARDAILDAVLLSCGDISQRRIGRMRRPEEDRMPVHLQPDAFKCENLLSDLANIAIKACARTSPHLLDCQVDINPEVQSFWYLRQMDMPNKSLKYMHTGNFFPHSNTGVQFIDSAAVNIRSRIPLDPVVDQDHDSVVTEKFTSTKRNPAADGFAFKRWRVATHAGFWPGTDDFHFPHLTLYPLSCLMFRNYVAGRELDDRDYAINGMGLMYSFAWCNSLAFYQGFSPYDELTYPFVTQTICTDGQTWNFTVYQLNTHSFHGDLPEPTKCNIAWTSGPMKLFERIEDGKLVGVDDSVIDVFLKFVMREPSTAQQPDLSPYLSGELDMRPEAVVADEEFKLRRLYGQAVSNREKWLRERARTLDFEWIQCERNPHAPPAIGFRRAPKYDWLMRLDRKKLTV